MFEAKCTKCGEFTGRTALIGGREMWVCECRNIFPVTEDDKAIISGLEKKWTIDLDIRSKENE